MEITRQLSNCSPGDTARTSAFWIRQWCISSEHVSRNWKLFQSNMATLSCFVEGVRDWNITLERCNSVVGSVQAGLSHWAQEIGWDYQPRCWELCSTEYRNSMVISQEIFTAFLGIGHDSAQILCSWSQGHDGNVLTYTMRSWNTDINSTAGFCFQYC